MSKYTYSQFTKICYESQKNLTGHQIHQMYLMTDRWEELRCDRLKIDQHRCRLCNKDAEAVHHRAYPRFPARLGSESVEDLTSLCNQCHENYHKPSKNIVYAQCGLDQEFWIL
jgi:5-methylcytosine-specific restriction endonuclease McrA